MTLSERENYCTEDPTTHEHDAPPSKDSENTLLEECGNVFSIQDPIFAEKLKGTRQTLIEDVMWGYRAFYGDDLSWERYTDSYKNVADRLVEWYVEEYRVDSLVYPIMFLYRHHLELQLKSLLRNLYSFHGHQWNLQKTHDLVKLWHEVRPLMEEICLQDTEDNDHIEARIKEFSQIDPDSESFRYPDRKSNPRFEHVPKKYREYINLFQVKCIVQSMQDRLRGMDEFLHVMLQIQPARFPPSRE